CLFLRDGLMPVRSSGLLYALSRTLLTMFEKPPSNLRQLPRDAIVAMFERAVRCHGASLVDNEPIVQYSREFVSACAVGWERRVSCQCRLILMERHLPATARSPMLPLPGQKSRRQSASTSRCRTTRQRRLRTDARSSVVYLGSWRSRAPDHRSGP